MVDLFGGLMRPDVAHVLVLLAVITFITRIGGYLVLARFERIPARVEAALEAVPSAVIATLVVPPALNGGVAEFVTMAVAILACLRFSAMTVITASLVLLVGLRHFGL